MSVEEALLAAKQLDETRQAAGFDQKALDNAARCGLGNGAFEDSEEDGGAVIEEFFPAAGDQFTQPRATARPHLHLTLSEKLEHQAKQHGQPNHPTETAHTPEEAS